MPPFFQFFYSFKSYSYWDSHAFSPTSIRLWSSAIQAIFLCSGHSLPFGIVILTLTVIVEEIPIINIIVEVK